LFWFSKKKIIIKKKVFFTTFHPLLLFRCDEEKKGEIKIFKKKGREVLGDF
jgi:hypothetical protein